jgi:hypothetical protein
MSLIKKQHVKMLQYNDTAKSPPSTVTLLVLHFENDKVKYDFVKKFLSQEYIGINNHNRELYKQSHESVITNNINNFYKKVTVQEKDLFIGDFFAKQLNNFSDKKLMLQLELYQDHSSFLKDITDIVIGMFDFMLKMVLMQISEPDNMYAVYDISLESIYYTSKPEKPEKHENQAPGFVLLDYSKIKKIDGYNSYYLAFRGLSLFLKFIINKFISDESSIYNILSYYVLIFHLLGDHHIDTNIPNEFHKTNNPQDTTTIKNSIRGSIAMQTYMILDLFDHILVELHLIDINSIPTNTKVRFNQNIFLKLDNSKESYYETNNRLEKIKWLHEKFKLLLTLATLDKLNTLDMSNGNEKINVDEINPKLNIVEAESGLRQIIAISEFWKNSYTPNYKLIIKDISNIENTDKILSIREKMNDQLVYNQLLTQNQEFLSYSYELYLSDLSKKEKNNPYIEQIISLLKFMIEFYSMPYVEKMMKFYIYFNVEFDDPPFIIFEGAKICYPLIETKNFKEPLQKVQENLIITCVKSFNYEYACELKMSFILYSKMNLLTTDFNQSHIILDIFIDKKTGKLCDMYVYEGTKYIHCNKDQNIPTKLDNLNDVLQKNISFKLNKVIEYTFSLLQYTMYGHTRTKGEPINLYNDRVFFYNDRIYFSNLFWQIINMYIKKQHPKRPEINDNNIIFQNLSKDDAGGVLKFFYIILSKDKKEKYKKANFENKKECFENFAIQDIKLALEKISLDLLNKNNTNYKKENFDAEYNLKKTCIENR